MQLNFTAGVSNRTAIIVGVTVPVGLLLLAVLLVLAILAAVMVHRFTGAKTYDTQFIHKELSETSKGDDNL